MFFEGGMRERNDDGQSNHSFIVHSFIKNDNELWEQILNAESSALEEGRRKSIINELIGIYFNQYISASLDFGAGWTGILFHSAN